MTWIRALAAAGISMVFPGAGHALIRDWGRALIFSGLFVASVALFLPTGELWAAASSGSVGEVMGILESETSIVEQFTLSFLALFAAIDAGFQALGLTQRTDADEDGQSCPHCGKSLDEDLTFCHWCTTRLEPEVPDDDEPVSQ